MSLLSLCSQRMTVERSTVASDGAMGVERTWAAVYEGVPCLAQKVSAREIEASGSALSEVTHRIFTTRKMDLRPGDRLVIGEMTFRYIGHGDATGHGRLYELLARLTR